MTASHAHHCPARRAEPCACVTADEAARLLALADSGGFREVTSEGHIPEDLQREMWRRERRARSPWQVAADALAERRSYRQHERPGPWVPLLLEDSAPLTARPWSAIADALADALTRAAEDESTESSPGSPPDWPGTSDHHPDTGPAHPLTATHTLVAAPGAPSIRVRAAA